MKRDIVVVILAAGAAKRFWPFSTDKNLFPFFDRKFIEYALPFQFPPEVSTCVIVANPQNKHMFDAMKFSVPTVVVVQEKPSGMAGALISAKKYIMGKRILSIIADDISDPSLMPLMIKNIRPDVFGVLSAWKPKTYFPGGYIAFQDGRPYEIREKPGEGKIPSEYVYFGGQIIENADLLFTAIDAIRTDTDDVYEQALSLLMKSNRFSVVTYEKDFVSLKYPWHVLDALRYLFAHHFTPGKGRSVDIRNNVSIEGQVYIGSNVKIFENTKIVGPAYIGDDTIIGNNNIIRDSFIGSRCVTGFSTDITRSYIGDDCWFHSNYIGDSVLEGNVSMGSGSVLANLRLDEKEIFSVISGSKIATNRTKLGSMIGKGVRIGVNASIMPGIKIGANSLIGAGTIVDRDIPDNSFCVGHTTYEIKQNTKHVESGKRDQFKSKI